MLDFCPNVAFDGLPAARYSAFLIFVFQVYSPSFFREISDIACPVGENSEPDVWLWLNTLSFTLVTLQLGWALNVKNQPVISFCVLFCRDVTSLVGWPLHFKIQSVLISLRLVLTSRRCSSSCLEKTTRPTCESLATASARSSGAVTPTAFWWPPPGIRPHYWHCCYSSRVLPSCSRGGIALM